MKRNQEIREYVNSIAITRGGSWEKITMLSQYCTTKSLRAISQKDHHVCGLSALWLDVIGRGDGQALRAVEEVTIDIDKVTKLFSCVAIHFKDRIMPIKIRLDNPRLSVIMN